MPLIVQCNKQMMTIVLLEIEIHVTVEDNYYASPQVEYSQHAVIVVPLTIKQK